MFKKAPGKGDAVMRGGHSIEKIPAVRLSVFAVFMLGLAGVGMAQPKSKAATPVGQRLVEAARELLGTPYNFGGRLGTKEGRLRPGIDCQGVLFYAVEQVFPTCDWRSYSVMPTKSIARSELGETVDGFGPAKTSDVALDKLLPGDVLWLVGPGENPAEGAIATLDGERVWVWHTALYSGEGRMIVGDHYAGEAVEVPLLPYLREHADVYRGVIATRIDKRPKPSRCRRGSRLRQPENALSLRRRRHN